MRKTCPVCGSSKYQLINGEFRCSKCHFISIPKKTDFSLGGN